MPSGRPSLDSLSPTFSAQVVGQAVPLLVGGTAYGLQLLYELHEWMVALPIGGLLVLCVVISLTLTAARVLYTVQRRARTMEKAAGRLNAAALLSPIGLEGVQSPAMILTMDTKTPTDVQTAEAPALRVRNTSLRRVVHSAEEFDLDADRQLASGRVESRPGEASARARDESRRRSTQPHIPRGEGERPAPSVQTGGSGATAPAGAEEPEAPWVVWGSVVWQLIGEPLTSLIQPFTGAQTVAPTQPQPTARGPHRARRRKKKAGHRTTKRAGEAFMDLTYFSNIFGLQTAGFCGSS